MHNSNIDKETDEETKEETDEDYKIGNAPDLGKLNNCIKLLIESKDEDI